MKKFAFFLFVVPATVLAATFVVSPPRGVVGFVEPEALAFSTDDESQVTALREIIQQDERKRFMFEIAAGADGINRNFLAPTSPAWRWHVVRLISITGVDQLVIPATRRTPLADIDTDPVEWIATNGSTLYTEITGKTFLSELDPADLGKVANVSSRGVLGSGDRVLITGFVVSGSTPRVVLVRALGPSLTEYGVTGAAADPWLRLYRGSELIGWNDDWSDAATSLVDLAAIAPDGMRDFLPTNDKESALLMVLPPGAYMIHAGSPNEAIGLVDVHDLSEFGF